MCRNRRQEWTRHGFNAQAKTILERYLKKRISEKTFSEKKQLENDQWHLMRFQLRNKKSVMFWRLQLLRSFGIVVKRLRILPATASASGWKRGSALQRGCAHQLARPHATRKPQTWAPSKGAQRESAKLLKIYKIGRTSRQDKESCPCTKLWRARSRLYRGRYLQASKILWDPFYKICTLLHRSNSNISQQFTSISSRF